MNVSDALGSSVSRIMTPASGLNPPDRFVTLAIIVTSPETGRYTKCIPSDVPRIESPAPLTVNAPFVYVALPVSPTGPTSWLSQGKGSGWFVTSKSTGLLSSMLGATETTNGPEVAPVGSVMVIAVALQ